MPSPICESKRRKIEQHYYDTLSIKAATKLTGVSRNTVRKVVKDYNKRLAPVAWAFYFARHRPLYGYQRPEEVKKRVEKLKSRWPVWRDERRSIIHEFLDRCVYQFTEEWQVYRALMHLDPSYEKHLLIVDAKQKMEMISTALKKRLHDMWAQAEGFVWQQPEDWKIR